MLWNDPLTRTATFGTVYEPSILNCDRNGVSAWHCPRGVTVPALLSISGSLSITSQTSSAVLPKLTPPWSSTLCGRRILVEASKPLKFCACFP